MADALPHIANAPDITRAELVREILTGSRLVSFPHVVSFGVTVYDPGPVWLIRPGDPARSARGQIATSLVFGWWGLSGIGSTLQALKINRAGGDDQTELFFGTYATAAILRHGRPRSQDEPVNEEALREAVPDGHLPASGPPRGRTRSYALAALVAVTVPALVTLAILADSPGRRIDELEVGDCFDLRSGDDTTVDLRSCDELHDAQLLGLARLGDETLDADEATRLEAARSACRELAGDAGIGDAILDAGVVVDAFLQERGPDELRRIARCHAVSDVGLRSSLVSP